MSASADAAKEPNNAFHQHLRTANILGNPSINRKDWLLKVLREHPEISDLRDRLTPLNRASSFINTYDKGRRRGQISTEDMLNLVYQYLCTEGLHEVAKVFLSEAEGYKIKLLNTGDVRLLTLLRLVLQWTENLWDLAINDKKLDPIKLNAMIEEQLMMVNLLKTEKDFKGTDTSIGVGIWEEPREGNIIYEDSTGQEVSSTIALDGYILRAGTLNKIVEEITPTKNVNNTFVSLFLLTYRSFTTPEILLVKLRQRYDVPREENQEDQQYKEKALPIQLRVINVIKLWLDTCFNEMSNKFLLELKDFIDTKLMRDHVGQAKSILQILEKQEKLKVSSEKPNFIFNKPPEAPIIPKGGKIFLPELDWMDLDPQEIARQLTLIEFEMLYKIKPSEFLNQSWNKPKLRHNAKNILDYIDYFNKFSMWCSTRIIFPQKIKQRVKAWVKLIQVADHCYQLKNFNSLTALLSSFMTAPVFRLKHTKAAIPQLETDKWNELSAIMDMEGGFSRYRKELENTTSACIPYFGLFLTDLTFTEDGNMDEYKGLINWTKRKLIGQILQKIKNYQSSGFNIQPIYQIQQIFRVLKHRRTEEEQYADSLLREPRKADRSQIE